MARVRFHRVFPLCVVIAAALAVPAAARAAHHQLRIVEDDRLLLLDGPAVQSASLAQMASLGAQVVRVEVVWRSLEPAGPRVSPARWAPLDGLIARARADGLRPLLDLTSPAPRWAAGSRGAFHSVRPDVAAFARFVAAVGARYDGAAHGRVALWSLWNEPNDPEFLMPQRAHDGKLLAAAMLRRLLYAGADALAATGHRDDTLLVGELLPVGTNGRCAICTQDPVTFARELLCVNSHNQPLVGAAARGHPGCGGRFRPLPGTGWSIHPYTQDGAPLDAPPSRLDISPDHLGGLERLLWAAERLHRVRPGIRLWETEDGTQTDPPDARLGVRLAAAARDIDLAEWLAWRNPDVASVAQYPLRDDAPRSGFHSGLLFADGRPKPSLAAYRLPLIVWRSSAHATRVHVWLHAPPGSGRVELIGPGSVVHELVVPRGGYLVRTFAAPRRAGPWVARLADGDQSRTATAFVS